MPDGPAAVAIAVALLAGAAVPIAAAEAKPPSGALANPEARANALKDVSQHLICQCSCNMILSECSHQSCPFALPEREQILKDLESGKSSDAIVASYVARFGSGIRATPPTSGSLYDRIAWYLPYIALTIGAGVVVAYLVRVTRAVSAGSPEQRRGRLGGQATADPYVRRVEQELGGDRGDRGDGGR